MFFRIGGNLPFLYFFEYIHNFFGFPVFRAGNRVDWVVLARLGAGEGVGRGGLENYFRTGRAGKRAGRRDGGGTAWTGGEKVR